ncbi:DUF4198 domain-containing protein [Campylobacter pinnipediorum]|uniref:DUF4198 domain-containing protein n=1 Tax=Campylobacter pinnipediorum TaxID=1965231 RepID=UPI00084DB4C2|nr:DUF4198 domain-containing protein [Campylobacter pinnipediorum]
MLKKILSLAVVATLGFTVNANAHQIIASSVGKNKFEAKFWAHTQFDDYNSNQLLGAKAYDDNLNQIKTGIKYHYNDDSKKPEILTEKAPAIMVTVFDAKYWVETDAGYKNGNKTKIDDVVFDDIKSVKIGKTYFSWNEKFLNPIGLKLEVIALNDPLKVKVGDSLPVLVLKDGKPVKGVAFETTNEDLDNLTNEFGIALIPIKEKGLNIIAARGEEPLFNDPDAHTLFIQSSISFEVK